MYVVPKIELDDTIKEIKKLALQIRHKKAIIKDEARINKQSRKPVMPRTAGAKVRDRSVSKLREDMENLGVDMSNTEEAHFTKTKPRARSVGQPVKNMRMEVSSSGSTTVTKKTPNKNRSLSRTPRNELGVKDGIELGTVQDKSERLQPMHHLRVLLLIKHSANRCRSGGAVERASTTSTNTVVVTVVAS
ncbi:unnamed protein product [Brassicogethes aeneus]|uniref:Uncharacterized protein n=1 Tax=Brassicogethes aeneus TaxID=1431903 RepID=A0A9P0FDH4_BRAAE|nr:unnamed protein product [Brassicogethes aeneus]